MLAVVVAGAAVIAVGTGAGMLLVDRADLHASEPLTVVPALSGPSAPIDLGDEGMLLDVDETGESGSASGIELVRWDWTPSTGALSIDATVVPASPSARCTLIVSVRGGKLEQAGEMLTSDAGVAHCVAGITDPRLDETADSFVVRVVDGETLFESASVTLSL